VEGDEEWRAFDEHEKERQESRMEAQMREIRGLWETAKVAAGMV
jgi:transcription initiation factor TFIIIB Brf1 subunit/transcription initiation factor TFIIB